MPRPRKLAIAATSLAAIGLMILVVRSVEWTDAEPVATEKPAPEAMIVAAAARIAEESQGTLASAEILAAPRAEAGADLGAAPAGRSPAPPHGHSFVEFHGEMGKGRIESREQVQPERDDELDWLGAATSVDDLVAQALDAGRDWSFGWIRLSESARADDLARALRGTGTVIVGSAGRLIRARLPGDANRLRAISELIEVDGLGAAPAEAKVRAVVGEALARSWDTTIPSSAGTRPMRPTTSFRPWRGLISWSPSNRWVSSRRPTTRQFPPWVRTRCASTKDPRDSTPAWAAPPFPSP